MSVHRPAFLPAHSMHLNGLRDHSPLGFSLGCKSNSSNSCRPIPSFVTRHPDSQKLLLQLEVEHKVSFQSLKKTAKGNPFNALASYNNLVRHAAAQTRNILQSTGSNLNAGDQLLTTVSRAKFYNNVSHPKF